MMKLITSNFIVVFSIGISFCSGGFAFGWSNLDHFQAKKEKFDEFENVYIEARPIFNNDGYALGFVVEILNASKNDIEFFTRKPIDSVFIVEQSNCKTKFESDSNNSGASNKSQMRTERRYSKTDHGIGTPIGDTLLHQKVRIEKWTAKSWVLPTTELKLKYAKTELICDALVKFTIYYRVIEDRVVHSKVMGTMKKKNDFLVIKTKMLPILSVHFSPTPFNWDAIHKQYSGMTESAE
jgi:hypothetical protein